MTKPKAKVTAPKGAGKNLDIFRAENDPQVVIKNRIEAALAEMLKIGPQEYDIEADFQERAKLTQKEVADWRPKFKAHVVEVPRKDAAPKRFWFADPKVAAVALTPKSKP